jgi:hypothetical protein
LLIVPLTVAILWVRRFRTPVPRQALAWLIALLPLAWLLLEIRSAFATQNFVAPILGFYHILLLTAFLVGTIGLLGHTRKGMVALLMLAMVTWASAISWGYTIPALYALPGVFGLLYVLGHYLRFLTKWRGYQWVAATIAFIGFFMLQLYPYSDAPRDNLNYDAGEVFDGLRFIRTGQYGYSKLQEFKAMYMEYGDPYTVLPTMPLAHFLTRSTPVVGIDWAYDIETGNSLSNLITELETSKSVVFVERHRMDEGRVSSLLQHVLDHWVPIDSSAYFVVYAQSGNLSSRLGPPR